MFAALAQRLLCRYAVNFSPLSIVHTPLKRVANFHSTWPFCCGIHGAVYLKSIPSPSCVQALLKTMFSPALSQQMYYTCKLYLFSKFLIKPNIVSTRSDFSFRNKLQIKLLLSSMMISQCCLLPKVGVEGELVSKKSLSHKISEQDAAFLLPAHCLALPRVQSSHGLEVLVIWIQRAFVVV